MTNPTNTVEQELSILLGQFIESKRLVDIGGSNQALFCVWSVVFGNFYKRLEELSKEVNPDLEKMVLMYASEAKELHLDFCSKANALTE